MTFLSALGELPAMALGLAFSLGCALLLGFACLRLLVGLMTRQQYNVTNDPDSTHDLNLTNDPSHARSILWLGAAVADAGDSSADRRSGATGGPYLVPAAAPVNRFTRDPRLNIVSSKRAVEFSHTLAGRITQIGHSDNGGAA
jgi:hypothetical protein